MTRLAAAELRKIWRSRFFLTALGVLLAANLFLLWFGTQRAPGSAPASAYRALEAQTAGMGMDELDIFLHGELARAEALSHIDYTLRTEAYMGGRQDETLRAQYAEDFARYYGEYAAGDFLRYAPALAQEYRFLDAICMEFEQVDGYEAFLDSIDRKAQQLSQISIFAQSESGYDMANIRATAADFAGMRGTAIQYYPQKGLVTALDFALTDVVAVFAMVLIATVLVRAERDGGLLALVRSAPAGRLATAAAKMLALAASLGLVLACLYGTNLAYCGGLYGLGPLSRTIQSVPALMRSTWKLTVGQYLGCFFLTKWAAAFICGAGVLTAMLLARRLFTGALGLIGANLLIRSAIPAASRWNVVKYANLVSLLRTNELLGGYRNLYWFDEPVPLLAVACAAAAAFLALFSAAFCVAFSRCYFVPARRRAGGRRLRRAPAFTTPLRQEAYKLFWMQGAAVLLALFGAFQVYTARTAQSYIDADEIYYRYYMQNVQGPLTQESADWLAGQSEEFEPIYRLNAALAAGEIAPSEYQMFISGYAGLQQKLGVFQRVVARAQTLGERPRMQMVYETGWLRLFDVQDAQDLADTLWLALLCAVCFSGLFAMERQTGMARVIGTTPLGRAHTVRCKLAVTAVCCGALTALSLLPRFWVAVRDYGLGAWLAPVYSIGQYAAAPEIPLFLMAFLLAAGRFAAVLAMAMVTLWLSQRIGSTLGAMFASLGLFALPALLALAGLAGMKWCSMYVPVHLCALLAQPGGAALAVLAPALAAGVCWLCAQSLLHRFARA